MFSKGVNQEKEEKKLVGGGEGENSANHSAPHYPGTCKNDKGVGEFITLRTRGDNV